MFTLNCRGRLLTFHTPIVMGILNVTPDSFYAGSRVPYAEDAVQKAANMIRAGAAILDIGGQSTRPGSTYLGANEEADRVLPVIEAVYKAFPDTILSVDTFHASVAATAVAMGAGIINDISGGMFDAGMLPAVAKLKTPYICMHIKGTPQNMQKNPSYDNVTKEVLDYFTERVYTCQLAGMHDVILDPGFGFGKTIRHNFELLNNLALLKTIQKPIMVGFSRKSSVYKILCTTPEHALNGTTVLNTVSLLYGADILRVHDVKEACEAIQLTAALRQQ